MNRLIIAKINRGDPGTKLSVNFDKTHQNYSPKANRNFFHLFEHVLTTLTLMDNEYMLA